MTSIIKNIHFLVIFIFLLYGCNIQNPKEENCRQIEIAVEEIFEDGIKDIAFSSPDGKFFYINRGLEQGLTLEEMKNKVLNKKVTLHLAKTKIEKSPKHIAQISLGEEVIYTEFN